MDFRGWPECPKTHRRPFPVRKCLGRVKTPSIESWRGARNWACDSIGRSAESQQLALARRAEEKGKLWTLTAAF
jgi:hypothetical protein